MIINKEQVDAYDGNGNKYKKLIVSYIDQEGSIKFLQYPIPNDQMFNWMYASRAKADPVWTSYDKKYVKRVPTNRLSEYRLNELLCSFGEQINPIFEPNVPRTGFSDIEVNVVDEFPDPEHAHLQPINTMSLVVGDKVILWARKDLSENELKYVYDKFAKYEQIEVRKYKFEFRFFDNEANMIIDYLKYIRENISHLTGWNFLGYDWPYIYNRCKALNLDISWLSPTGKFWHYNVTTKQGTHRDVMLPMHLIISDYMMIFQKWDQTIKIKENFTLDWIAGQILGYKKVQHKLGFKEFYEREYPDYCFYNCVDSILVAEIDKKVHTANIWYSLTAELRTELMMQFSTVTPTEVVMVNFCYKDCQVLPSNKKEVTGGDYPGAFVWPTQPGIYKWIGGLDFASLYPTTQRQFNISPETYLFTDKTGTYVPKENEIKCVSGQVFTKEFDGLLPRILTHYFAARKHSKACRKQVDKEMEFLKAILVSRKNGVQPETNDFTWFEYASKDYDWITVELPQLDKEIARLQLLSEYYDAKQLSEKLFLNSCYGACANKYFIGFNLEVATAITSQGQDLNHFSENMVNRYFSGIFQKDTALHAKLGIDSARAAMFDMSKGRITDNGPLPDKPEYSHIEGRYSMTVAGDTDSIYVEFGRVVNYLNIPLEKQAEFVVNLWKFGCGPYMDQCYEDYAKMYNCNKNLEVLELEKVTRTNIMYAKKHYAMEEVWEEPGVFLPDMSAIIYKGLEVNQGSCPKYARECQKDMIEYVLRSYITNDKPSYQSLIDRLKKYKAGMEIQPIDDICKTQSVGDYEKFIREDKQRVVVELHCPVHVRASAYYNNKLLNDRQYMNKYSRIKSGDKVKFYYTTGNQLDVFAFLPGSFPIEIAPKVDYEIQFEKMILEPLNKLIKILGYEPLSSNLCYSEALW